MAIRFQVPGGEVLQPVEPELTLAQLAVRAGILLETPCGGHGVCGRCQVLLHEGRYRIGDEEVDVSVGRSRLAMACQTRVVGDHAHVEIRSASAKNQIQEDFVQTPYRVAPIEKRIRLSVSAPSL
ncbi:MAG: 2Fe-2S iron-sulfur cluster-binding protein, partial [Kiritimatiellia bacterium]|nr:2Fe-2S iron-sulfur cluster-binding protein [Kiritimatiellia bacterium]